MLSINHRGYQIIFRERDETWEIDDRVFKTLTAAKKYCDDTDKKEQSLSNIPVFIVEWNDIQEAVAIRREDKSIWVLLSNKRRLKCRAENVVPRTPETIALVDEIERIDKEAHRLRQQAREMKDNLPRMKK